MHISIIKASVFAASMLAGAILIAGNQSAAIAAGAGCCMQRDAETASAPWYQINEDFEGCEALNQRRDRNQDDVFEPAGFIWWNVDC